MFFDEETDPALVVKGFFRVFRVFFLGDEMAVGRAKILRSKTVSEAEKIRFSRFWNGGALKIEGLRRVRREEMRRTHKNKNGERPGLGPLQRDHELSIAGKAGTVKVRTKPSKPLLSK